MSEAVEAVDGSDDPVGSHFAVTGRAVRNSLIAAESASLTGARPDADGIASGASVERIARAAYVRHGVSVMARGATLDELVVAVSGASQATGFDADRFRVEVHDPADRLALTSTQVAIAVADAIPDYPDLKDPVHRFVVAVRADGLVFGEVVAVADHSYRLHDGKPWTTSSSLDSRLARALVNLVPDARSIFDPCCGAGSIVIEAASLGLEAFGVDWKTAMVGMTRENLAHFDYSGSVVQADSRTHAQPADAVVTDLPYGHAIDADEAQTRAILEQAAALAPLGVFVAPDDMSDWLAAAGYVDIEVSTVNKRRGFTRWIHVARSTRAPTPAAS